MSSGPRFNVEAQKKKNTTTTLVEHNIETGGEVIQTKQGERGSKQIVKGEHDLQKNVELFVVKLDGQRMLRQKHFR